MSTETKISNGTGFHFAIDVEEIRCSADDVLSRVEKDNIRSDNFSKSKPYSTVAEYCEDVANELSQRQAFYVIDFADVLWKIQEWKKFLPNVEIFYAVKANTDPVLLKLLAMLRLSFDCASAGEIQMVLDAGASPSNIILAHTIKTVEELKFASEKGVELMTFDNEDELLKVHRVYPKARLVVRIVPDSVNCPFDLSEKFGCSKDEAIRLLKLAKQLDLNVVGVSFHVGALCKDPTPYTSTIETSRMIFDVAKELGFSFTILDIGGGFLGQIGTESILYTTADSINKSTAEHFNCDKIRIIAEPGTYISCSAGRLVCTVLGRRCFENKAIEHPRRHYYLNDGLYGSFFRGVLHYDIEPIPLLSESEIQSRSQYASTLFGQTCCCEDIIMRNVILPDLKVGDRLMWINAGAYCQGVMSTFCGVPFTITKYIFVENHRLNWDWMDDRESVLNFLKKHVTFVGGSGHPIS